MQNFHQNYELDLNFQNKMKEQHSIGTCPFLTNLKQGLFSFIPSSFANHPLNPLTSSKIAWPPTPLLTPIILNDVWLMLEAPGLFLDWSSDPRRETWSSLKKYLPFLFGGGMMENCFIITFVPTYLINVFRDFFYFISFDHAIFKLFFFDRRLLYVFVWPILMYHRLLEIIIKVIKIKFVNLKIVKCAFDFSL